MCASAVIRPTDILLYRNRIVFVAGQILIDGARVYQLPFIDTSVSIGFDADKILIAFASGVRVSVSESSAAVTLPYSHGIHACGLCGSIPATNDREFVLQNGSRVDAG